MNRNFVNQFLICYNIDTVETNIGTGGDSMTPERLEEANRLSGKIKMLRKRLEDLAYLQEAPEISISAKDGRKMYESYVTVPVGSARNLILNEVRYRLERQLKDAEKQLKEL
jgi:hypothetical protein